MWGPGIVKLHIVRQGFKQCRNVPSGHSVLVKVILNVALLRHKVCARVLMVLTGPDVCVLRLPGCGLKIPGESAIIT